MTDNTSCYMMIPNRFIDEPVDWNLNSLKEWGRKRLIYPHALKIRYRNLLKKLHFKTERIRKTTLK